MLDFTDLIENSLDIEVAPGAPQVGWVDEAQDLTPLELTLVRHWGKQMRELTIVGDPDQAIFTFKGAAPEAFLDPSVSAEHREVLDQSYRVPRAVSAVAQRWIEHLGDRRLPIVSKPRDADGLVRLGGFDFTSEALIRDVIKQIEAERSVVILATTSFGLNAIKDGLRRHGVPFHNPLRRSRPDWNPLHPQRGVSTAQKILAYLALDERIFGEDTREWTGKDVKAWSSLLTKTGVFRRGAAAMIAGLPDRTLTYEEVASLFDSEEVLEQALEPSLPWLRSHLQAGYKQTAQFPLKIAEVFGPQTLAKTPLVSIGTVHSYKGGSGDVIFVSAGHLVRRPAGVPVGTGWAGRPGPAVLCGHDQGSRGTCDLRTNHPGQRAQATHRGARMKIKLSVAFTFDGGEDSTLDRHVAIADVARALDTAEVTEVGTASAVVSAEYETLDDLLTVLRGDRWTESDQTLDRFPLDSPTGPV